MAYRKNRNGRREDGEQGGSAPLARKGGPKPRPIVEFPEPLTGEWNDPPTFSEALAMHMSRHREDCQACPSGPSFASLTSPLLVPGQHVLMRNCPSFIDILERLKGQFVTSLLLRQPFAHCQANDPALASVAALGDFVQSRGELIRQLHGDHSPIHHLIPVKSLGKLGGDSESSPRDLLIFDEPQ